MGFHYKYDTLNARYQLEFMQYIEVIEVSDAISSNSIRSIYDQKLLSLKKALRHFENVETKAKVTYTGIEEKLTLKATVSIECADETLKKILETITQRYNAIFIPG